MNWLREPSTIPRWLHLIYVFILFTSICQQLFGVPS